MPTPTPLHDEDPATLGRFRLVGRLGEGGQGIVYLAQAPEFGEVAIKVLRAATMDRDLRARVEYELAAAMRVAPFCTARILDADVDGPVPYIVSEYVDGPSLQEMIKVGGPLAGEGLKRLAVGTVTALSAIHEAGIVHRDFKPANVLMAADGPRVVDFSIARMLDGRGPGHPAPEGSFSAAADLYAWGATMLYAATGRSPFQTFTEPDVFHQSIPADPVALQAPGILPLLRDLIARCLIQNPAARPTAEQVMLALLGDITPPAPPSPPSPPSPPGTFPAPQGGRRTATGAFDVSHLPGSRRPPNQPPADPYPPQAMAHAGPQPIVHLGPPTAPHPSMPPGPSTGPQPVVPLGPQPVVPPGPPTGPHPAMAPGPSTGPQPVVPLGPSTGPQPVVPSGPPTGSHPVMPPGPSTGRQPGPHPGMAGPVTGANSRLPALLGSVMLLVLIVGGSAGAYALTRSPSGSSSNEDSGAPIPAAFTGTWSGSVNQVRPTAESWRTVLKLGAAADTIDYPGTGCSGTVAVVSVAQDRLVLSQTVTGGAAACPRAGYLTLTAPGPTVRVDYSDDLGISVPTASGELTKQ